MATYPKDYFDTWNGETDQGLCFVIMPFDETFRPVWDTIKQTIQNDPFNIRCVRADEISRPGTIMEDVLQYIAEARLVIADMTGRNPNVFYELGITHSCKPSSDVILLTRTIDDVPFDLRHLRCLVYREDLSDLPDRLSAALSQGDIRQYSIEVAEGMKVAFPARVTGTDNCLYELEILCDYLGDEGIKFRMRRTRFVAGHEPEISEPSEGHYLGTGQEELEVPVLGWKLRYGGGSRETTRILLNKA